MNTLVSIAAWVGCRLIDGWIWLNSLAQPASKHDRPKPSEVVMMNEPRTGALKRKEKLWPFYPDVEADAEIELWTDKGGMFVRFTGTANTGETHMRFVGIPNPWDRAAPKILLEDSNAGYFLNALYVHNKAIEQRQALEATPA